MLAREERLDARAALLLVAREEDAAIARLRRSDGGEDGGDGAVGVRSAERGGAAVFDAQREGIAGPTAADGDRVDMHVDHHARRAPAREHVAAARTVAAARDLADHELAGGGAREILGGELDSGEHLAVGRCEGAGGEAANRWYTLVARGASGKQVRQLFERHGALVSRVQRTRLGPLALERTLGRSQFRELAQEELDALLAPVADGGDWASKDPPLTP